MTYRDQIRLIASRSESAVRAIYQRLWSTEDFDDDDFVSIVTARVSRANHQARTLAALGFLAQLTMRLRRPTPMPRLVIPDDRPRLAQAARTVLTTAHDSDVPEDIVGRLGRAEPLGAAAETYSQAIGASPHAHGWIRQLNPGACTLCQWWAAGGKIFPADMQMAVHPGCTCTQEIVTR